MDPNKFFNRPNGPRVLNFTMVDDPDLVNRMSRLLNVVALRLPEEEQFRFAGAFMFSSRDKLGKIWEEFDNKVPPDWKEKISSSVFAPDMNQVEKKDWNSLIDGYCTFEFDLESFKNLAEKGASVMDILSGGAWVPFYVVSILTDSLADKSDDYIIGLIAYELSEMSYAWRKNKIENGHLDSLETQGYEDSVVGEARRLGFGKEMDKFK